jgi:site-specific recombinase XerD
MSLIAPTLQAYFTDRLIRQRQASPHTIAAYRDSLRILLAFAAKSTGKAPSQLDIADLGAPLIAAFLDHLERERGNSTSTRNTRLAAIHSLFRFASLYHPDHADDIARVLAIPPKRERKTDLTFLDAEETETLLAASDLSTWTGRRDHALLTLAVQTGLRVSELAALTIADLHLGTGPHVACHGKGRKGRITPLTTTTVRILRAWLLERAGLPIDPLFPTRRGRSLSRDAIAERVALCAERAAQKCQTLSEKEVTPHVLRHTAAMRLLRSGIDITVIALWLGHEDVNTTQAYIHADMSLKQQALVRTTPVGGSPGCYRAPDHLLAFLDSL